MKRIYFKIIGLLLVGPLLLVACSQQPAKPAAEQPTPAKEEVTPVPTQEEEASSEVTPAGEESSAETESSSAGKIAVLLSGPADDNSWNEAVLNALEVLKTKGYETAFAEDIPAADGARVLREFADEGFETIVAHSFSYQDSVFEVAEEYSEVNFAWPGGIGGTAANVADYDQPFYEAAYLVGIIAGHVSESGKLGAIYGFDIPVCHAMGQAALAGAKTVNPKAELLVTATGDWNDVSKAKEAGLAQSEAGVDFWVQCGQGPTFGAIEAAREAGGYVTGYVGDMSENGSNEVLVNLVWILDPLFEAMMTDFEGTFYQFGVAEGSLDVVVNPALADKIPAEALEQVEAAKAKIVGGELEVPFVPSE
ncbi:MAG: BMP family ABC transporter substrate-binding protein [Chloroflexota bacterium]|nr:MAG: BMP family ABC transporter substrate-binding protein [Chloroflexota bacterium]